MNVLSDSESSDSDAGRRFKTEATRARDDLSSKKHNDSLTATNSRRDYRRYTKSRSRSRSRDRNARKRSRSRDRSHRRYDKNESTEKSSKRRDSREQRHNENRSKDKEKDKEKDRSSHHSSSSKSSEKYGKNHFSHKKSHSKSSTEEIISHKQKSQSSERATDSSDRNKRHKRSKDKNHREEISKKPTEEIVHQRRSGTDKQSDKADSSHKQNEDSNNMANVKNGSNQESETAADDSLMCGPSLPPHMLTQDKESDAIEPKMPFKVTEKRYGPSLPSNVAMSSKYDAKIDASIIDVSENEDDDDEIIIGPVLDHIHSKSEAHLELEKRALELKLAKLSEREHKTTDEIRGREEWMIELPELRGVTDLGLTARQFRTKERDEIKDRSSWTETPRDREEKSKKKTTSTHDDEVKIRHQKTERMHRERRDAEQEEAVRKHKKKHKRDESLLDMHQKKLKKKSQKDTEPVERRPFSRDTDLKVNRFDDAQKKSILKKAQLLDTRFNSGQSKYL